MPILAMMNIVMCGAGRGIASYWKNKTKRYALLLQTENLRIFHHCKESSESCNNGSEKDEDRHSSFTR